MQDIKRSLANDLSDYVDIILEEYGDYIPKDKRHYLCEKKDYTECIEIADTGTISLFYRDNKIYFPKLAFSVIDSLKKNPNYGINPNHKSYTEDSIIVNQNTFNDYIEHVIIAGLTAKQYFEESLLHETMHFCGCDGGDPIREGLTELKTRELALKKGLLTSACGYPKEIDIAIQLQNILGVNTMNKIAFAKNNTTISEILLKEHGPEAETLYFSVRAEMYQQFSTYLHQNYDGLDAPIKKAELYEKLDYTSAHELIEQYKTKQELTLMVGSQQVPKKEKNASETKKTY